MGCLDSHGSGFKYRLIKDAQLSKERDLTYILAKAAKKGSFEVLEWLKRNNTCPTTRKPVSQSRVTDNFGLRRLIDDYFSIETDTDLFREKHLELNARFEKNYSSE